MGIPSDCFVGDVSVVLEAVALVVASGGLESAAVVVVVEDLYSSVLCQYVVQYEWNKYCTSKINAISILLVDNARRSLSKTGIPLLQSLDSSPISTSNLLAAVPLLGELIITKFRPSVVDTTLAGIPGARCQRLLCVDWRGQLGPPSRTQSCVGSSIGIDTFTGLPRKG